MKKMIAAMVAAWAALGAFGVATHLPLDTRTGTRYARAEEPIAFDTAWGENVTQLVLNVDGTNALTATTATNGVYVWRPDFSSSRDVTLKLTLRGAVDAALTATFTTAAYDVPGQLETVTAGGAFFFAPSSDAEFFAVPHDWLVAAGLAHYGDATSGLAARLAEPYAPGYTGWEAFVAGLTARDQAFRAAVELVDGEIRVSWTPNLNTGAVTRIYTVYGRTNLEDGDWESVQPWHRFFKVAVAMPTGADGEETAVSGEGFVPQPEPKLGGVQLWENGPYWAECNVGATKPEEYGYYFWWGDTVGYARNDSDHGSAPVGRLHRRDGQPRGEVRRGDGAPRRAVADADGRGVRRFDQQLHDHVDDAQRRVRAARDGQGGLLDKEHLPSRCRQRPRLLPPQPRLVRRLLVLHAGFGQLLRVGPLLRFEKFLPGRLRLPPAK